MLLTRAMHERFRDEDFTPHKALYKYLGCSYCGAGSAELKTTFTACLHHGLVHDNALLRQFATSHTAYLLPKITKNSSSGPAVFAGIDRESGFYEFKKNIYMNFNGF